MMLIGLIKWFDTDKGFGVIGTPERKEYFLHINNFTNKSELILKGMPIAFVPEVDRKNRIIATESRLVGRPEDWKIIMSYLEKSDSVENEGKGFYRQQPMSLIDNSLGHFFKSISEERVSNIIIDYFDTDLNVKLFISYCEVLETNLSIHYSKDKADRILNKIFSHFGKNLNTELLFKVWKNKKFKYISYSKMDDYEIPERVLKMYIHEIGRSEINRIVNYSFGSSFCTHYINEQVKNIDILTTFEIKELYQLTEHEEKPERESRKYQLDILYAQKLEIELAEKANQLDIIKNSYDLDKYNRLLDFIPNQLTNFAKSKITEAINKIIVQKCSDEFKPELWIKGIIEEMPFELVSKYFLDKKTQTDKQILVLIKLQTDKQFELLKKYSEQYTLDSSFILLERLVVKEENLFSNFDLLEVLFDSDFWKNKKSIELIESFTNYVNTQSKDEQKLELFLKGYVKNVPHNIVLKNIEQLAKEDLKKIFKNISEYKSFIQYVLTKKVTLDNISSLSWLYDLAIEYLDSDNFNSFDQKVFYTVKQSEYFKFWEIGKAKIFPQQHVEELLQDKFENYVQIDEWIKRNTTTTKEISDFLFSFLHKQVPVTDRIIFYKQLNHIKYLLQLNEFNLEQIKQIQNAFYNIILWVLDKENVLDFELLKQKFIYFAPDEQVRIVRKLFFLKANGQFDLTIEKLNELTRVDLDLYKTNLEFNPDISLDISTDVVIKTLLSFQKTNLFIVESELFRLILNNLKLDKTKRFRFSNYFENCQGRENAVFDWEGEGKVSKVKFGDSQFYFAISIHTGKVNWEYSSRFGRDIKVYTRNSNFENLRETVKKIPGVKWNPNAKHWGVPSQFETEVLNFAKENSFFLDLEGSNYVNNIHLAFFMREGIPNGISFCEGRLANKPHKLFKKNFWWCGGQPCFNKCETIHKPNEWEKYTLLDFCEILGLNTDETNKVGDYIPKGHYYKFIAHINRFNRLLEKLYCYDCNHILYPSDFGTGNFAAHTVVRFQCRNESCSNNDEIYLNHCLNGQCNCIIDSRVSKRCDNGLFICENCGSCCSHNMLERRLSNLKLNGGYIHNNLVKCVNEKLGHLEKAEYFCYKCKSEMRETSTDVFQCLNCDVEYNTTEYKFKRPHIHLRKSRATTKYNGK